MTGEKNRSTTIEKLWNIDDKTLATPKHDEMVLWLLNKNNINELLGDTTKCEIVQTIGTRKYFDDYNTRHFVHTLVSHYTTHHENNNEYPQNITDFSIYMPPSQRGITQEQIALGKQIQNEFKAITGMKIKTKIESEMPMSRNGFIIGYVDIKITAEIINKPKLDVLSVCKVQINDTVWSKPVCIEVKPTIKSFGETLRQLRTYEHYLKRMPMLFTLDMRFKNAFETQGIKVLTYPDNK